MSLLSAAMTACTMIDKRTASDGRGGVVTVRVAGAVFQAAVVRESAVEARVAEAQGTKALYTITTRKTVNLQYHDVFRREGDGKIFRVTSDGDDDKTPPTAGLDMRNVSAEEWTLTGEVTNG